MRACILTSASVDSFRLTLVAQLVVFISAVALQSQWILRRKGCRPPPILRLCLLRPYQSTHPNRRRPPQSTISLLRLAKPQSAVTSVGPLRLQSARLRGFRQPRQPSLTSRLSTSRRRESFQPIWGIRCRDRPTSQAGPQRTRSPAKMCQEPSRSCSSWLRPTQIISPTSR